MNNKPHIAAYNRSNTKSILPKLLLLFSWVIYVIGTSKTHRLRRSLWDSKPSPQNCLSFEPTWVFWNPLVLVSLGYKAFFSYFHYSMICHCSFFSTQTELNWGDPKKHAVHLRFILCTESESEDQTGCVKTSSYHYI